MITIVRPFLQEPNFLLKIMSIGFSVDLSAHITYGYVKSPHGLNRNCKAIAALETLGWPVFLGAFSTVVGIMVSANFSGQKCCPSRC